MFLPFCDLLHATIRFRGLLRLFVSFIFVVLGLVKVRFCLFWIRSGEKVNMSIFKSGSPRSLTVVDRVSWVFPMKRCPHYIYTILSFQTKQTIHPLIHCDIHLEDLLPSVSKTHHPWMCFWKVLHPDRIRKAQGGGGDPGSGGWNDATREIDSRATKNLLIECLQYWAQMWINWHWLLI